MNAWMFCVAGIVVACLSIAGAVIVLGAVMAAARTQRTDDDRAALRRLTER